MRTAFLAVLLAAGLFGAAQLVAFRETYRRTYEPDPIVQLAPNVTLMAEESVRQRISGTSDLVERIASGSAPNDVVRIVDEVKRAGGEVTLDRKIVRRIERPVALSRSSIDAAFESSGRTYHHSFGATYEWENPTDAPAEMRFTFLFPISLNVFGDSELKGPHLRVDGREVTDFDPKTGASTWRGEVPAHGHVTASVVYRTEGARGYRYVPGPLLQHNFEFRTRGNRLAKPLPGSIAATARNRGASTWNLDDVQTGAPIAFTFPSEVVGEDAQSRALAFAPVALLIFAFGAWLLRPGRSLAATLAFGIGLAGISVLVPYVAPITTIVVGAIVAGVAGGVAIGQGRGAFAGLSGGLLAAVPSLVGHSTLALWMLGLLVLGPAVIRHRAEIRSGSRAYLA